MELSDMRGYMSPLMIVADSRQQVILDSILKNMCNLLLYHFKLVMYWGCTNTGDRV